MRLILFAHGSRDPRWRKPFEQLASAMAEELGADRVRLAYMEFTAPTLFDVAEEAAYQGVKQMRLLPLFFSAGAHVAEDIPAQVAAVNKAHPSLDVEVLPPVGEHPRMVAALHAIIRSALK